MVPASYVFIIKLVVAFLAAFIGYFIICRIAGKIAQSTEFYMPQNWIDIARYIVFYGLYLLLVIVILQSIGVNLSALLAAAGVAGVAIGFAAQTSLSNIISGVMLLFERSFRVGDQIVCNNVQGKVESIGLLSITLNTLDNRVIRIPNEQCIKSNVINLTGMPRRAISFLVTVDASVDIHRVEQIIQKVGEDFLYRIENKPVEILYNVFSGHAVGMSVGVWVSTSQVITAKSAFIKGCLDQANAEGVSFYIGAKEV